MVVKFCPEAMSPSSMMVEEEEMGYMLIAENSHCGTRGDKLADDVSGAADCAALAQGAEVKAFSLGTKYARGRCYAEGLDVTADVVKEFQKNRVNPPCPGGEWEKDDLLFLCSGAVGCAVRGHKPVFTTCAAIPSGWY